MGNVINEAVKTVKARFVLPCSLILVTLMELVSDPRIGAWKEPNARRRRHEVVDLTQSRQNRLGSGDVHSGQCRAISLADLDKARFANAFGGHTTTITYPGSSPLVETLTYADVNRIVSRRAAVVSGVQAPEVTTWVILCGLQ